MSTRVPDSTPPPVLLLGVPFHRVTLGETITWIGRRIRERANTYMATANVDFAAQASQDAELQRILLEADLVVCDGTPLVWASRWMNAPLPERVAGSDLVPAVCERAELEGWKLYFLGASTEVLEAARANLLKKHPRLKIAGMEAPPRAHLLDFDHEAIAERIRAAAPDVLFVAFGCPKQEKWIWMNYRRLGVPVSVGVGATFDFLAGKFSRAPGILGKLGLEWVYRLLQEPRRLAFRYLVDLWFFSRAAARQRLSLPPDRGGQAARAEHSSLGGAEIARVTWSGRIDAAAAAEMVLPEPGPDQKGLVLDVSGVGFVDSSGLGLLAKLYKNCASRGIGFVLVGTPPVLAKVLAATQLDKVIPSDATIEAAEARIASTLAGKVPFTAAPSAVPDKMVLQLKGDIRAGNAEEVFQSIAESWLTNPDGRELVIDLRDVGFIDSSGVGALLRIYKIVAITPESKITLVHANETVRNVLRLSRLEHVFGLHS